VARRVLTYVVAVGTALALATGCDSGGSPNVGAPTAGVPSASPSVPEAPAPSTSVPPGKPQKLRIGAKGAAVLALQRRLTELGYWNGTADSEFDGTTRQAVFALQKAAGLGRDGVVGPKTQKALDQGVRPQARSLPGSGYLVEIDLRRQLLMFVRDGQVDATLNTSTGSNEYYSYQGRDHLADTPPGHYGVGRQIDGWRHGPLGPLWRPKYFNGGIAVHGASSVPPYPASHGCARVSMAAMDWIWSTGRLPRKTKVWVYAT